MIFDQEGLEHLQREHREIPGKCQSLVDGFLQRRYENLRAQEFAKNGFLRRLKTLARCVDNVFQILPPDRTELPSQEELSDAAINIQAFVVNVFGSADNLAWIWVHENDLRQDNGMPIPNGWVGLRKRNEFIRGSFSLEFREYLGELDCWFRNLENFRHALAHRIPLYVPPYVVPDENLALYRELEGRMGEAFIQQDIAEYDRLSSEQEALAVFNPLMTHSFEENAEYIVFHSQILADYNTIDELGQRILAELGR